MFSSGQTLFPLSRFFPARRRWVPPSGWGELRDAGKSSRSTVRFGAEESDDSPVFILTGDPLAEEDIEVFPQTLDERVPQFERPVPHTPGSTDIVEQALQKNTPNLKDKLIGGASRILLGIGLLFGPPVGSHLVSDWNARSLEPLFNEPTEKIEQGNIRSYAARYQGGSFDVEIFDQPKNSLKLGEAYAALVETRTGQQVSKGYFARDAADWSLLDGMGTYVARVPRL